MFWSVIYNFISFFTSTDDSVYIYRGGGGVTVESGLIEILQPPILRHPNKITFWFVMLLFTEIYHYSLCCSDVIYHLFRNKLVPAINIQNYRPCSNYHGFQRTCTYDKKICVSSHLFPELFHIMSSNISTIIFFIPRWSPLWR